MTPQNKLFSGIQGVYQISGSLELDPKLSLLYHSLTIIAPSQCLSCSSSLGVDKPINFKQGFDNSDYNSPYRSENRVC